MFVASCTKNIAEQDKRAQEQRFFDLYVAANYPNVEPKPNGLYYLEHKAGTGASAGEEDWLLVNHVCYTIPEDDIYESYVENVAIDNNLHDSAALYGPYKMMNGTMTEGLKEGIMMMREGGQATIFFTSDLGYGSEVNGSIGAYQSLKYEIELLEVIKDMDAYEQAKIDSYVDTITNADTIYDPDTETFMYYIIDEATEGKSVATDSLIQLAYTGTLADGRIFDEKTAEDPFEFTFGDPEQPLIEGWNLGLPRLKEGEKARFVIPYQLAYGEYGNEDQESGLRTIPPYETLIFNIEVISVETPTIGHDE
jgi:FKBP-type peptidyl-prolyl cis-trans isomerase